MSNAVSSPTSTTAAEPAGEAAVYSAFISYSHAKDKPIAAALQSAVQRLGKPWYSRRAARIFRDDTSLSATPHLWPSIERALSQSRFLILFASPEAARSRWVAKEAQYWLDNKGVGSVLIALTSGELEWDVTANDFAWSDSTPLPPVLRGRFTAEPKWVDLRAYRTVASPRDHAFLECAADIAAAVRGLAKEDLLSEEVRQQRRAVRLASAAAGMLLLLAIGTAVAGLWAVRERDRALQTLAVTSENSNSLAIAVATKIRRTSGIPVETQREILGQIQKLQQQLVASWNSNVQLGRSQAIVHRELAQTLLLLGEIDSSLRSAERSLEIMQSLLAASSTDSPLRNELKRELSRTYNRIGDSRMAAGQYDDALDAFTVALTMREELANVMQVSGVQRELALSHERTGDAYFASGDPVRAREHYQDCLAIREKLALSEPENPESQADLAASYDRIGRTEEDAEQALAAFRRSIGIRERLTEQDPRDLFWHRDVAASYDLAGEKLLTLGRSNEAVEAFENSLRFREELALRNPGVARWKVNVALSHFLLGSAGVKSSDNYRRALDILESIHSAGELPKQDEGLLQELQRRLESEN